MDRLTFVRPLVKWMIEHALSVTWQYQGFGMLRMYPDGRRTRFNVWMPSLAVPGVSLIHNHPWNFRSLVVSGVLINQQYYIAEPGRGKPYDGTSYLCGMIRPGPGGGLSLPIKKVQLVEGSTGVYVAGQTYSQKWNEIHRTSPKEGTITINERVVPKGRPDMAEVFWPEGTDWVSAEPRPATQEEVKQMAEAALRWLEIAV